MASDLENLGLCVVIASGDSGVYAGDILTEFNNDGYRSCSTWDSTNIDYNSVKCAANLAISSADGATLFDARRSLMYEDGMSVALFYGTNYQVEVTPVNGGVWTQDQALSNCADLVAALKEKLGGSVTMLGDFGSSGSTDTNSTDTGSSDTTTTPTVETVEMPNFVGQIDGQVDNWLISNGYKFRADIKSTGYNPKISCLMAGDNQVLDQSPSPGTQVENTSSTQLQIYVDCEW